MNRSPRIPECAEHTLITIATRGGFAERVGLADNLNPSV